MSSESKPIYIVSVNNTPQRAKDLVAILIEHLQPDYSLVHVANTDSLKGVVPLLQSLVVVPQVLICSSQWTREQQTVIMKSAKELLPRIKTIEIPPGLNAEKGGEAVVNFLEEQMLSFGLPGSG